MAYKTFENDKYGYFEPKVVRDDFYDPPYGDVDADVPCPRCHQKPRIIRVWPKDFGKYQIRCFKCGYALGNRQLTEYGFYEWVPLFFDSIEEANREWKKRVDTNTIDY